LLLLRDPLERYRSGVLHRLTRTPGRNPETLAADAVERGRYALQLERLRAFFDDEKILVLQYEKCRLDPLGEYRRTLRFLGVAPEHEPQELERLRGSTMEPAKEPFEQALRTALEPDVARLRELVPDLELALWPNFAHLAPQAAVGGASPSESSVS
jgi:hypothetical protein